MSDVQFEENSYSTERFTPAPSGSPTLVKLLLKTGIVKNERQANYALVGIAVCATLLTLWVLKSSFNSGVRPDQNVAPGAFPALGDALGEQP
ncbi:MAG: hypothetical protein HYV67_04730 [Candidatus Taylorbacteria bacterium]|nr:hypothetical protein [Candidatus Taylorbacteria bacterium]